MMWLAVLWDSDELPRGSFYTYTQEIQAFQVEEGKEMGHLVHVMNKDANNEGEMEELSRGLHVRFTEEPPKRLAPRKQEGTQNREKEA
jgi:hypothetical protein